MLIFCGGGIYKGFVVCFYGYDLLKKFCKLGFKYVLSVKVKVGELVVIEDVVVEGKIVVLVK